MTQKYRSVEGLLRGLEILRAMNEEEGGFATITTLSARTGLHRTTIKRLLETLYLAGYVRPTVAPRGYVLALPVRQLSEGFTDETWIAGIATPALGELVERVVWPSDLTTPKSDQMVIRETNRRFSPFSFHRAMVGQRLPMLQSSAGRAFLGFCTENQRDAVVLEMQKGASGARQKAEIEEAVTHVRRETRAVGFGFNYGGWAQEQQFGGVAVPVIVDSHVIACLSVVFLIKSISPDDAQTRFLPHLHGAVERICQGLVESEAHLYLVPNPS